MGWIKISWLCLWTWGLYHFTEAWRGWLYSALVRILSRQCILYCVLQNNSLETSQAMYCEAKTERKQNLGLLVSTVFCFIIVQNYALFSWKRGLDEIYIRTCCKYCNLHSSIPFIQNLNYTNSYFTKLGWILIHTSYSFAIY